MKWVAVGDVGNNRERKKKKKKKHREREAETQRGESTEHEKVEGGEEKAMGSKNLIHA